MLVFKVLVLASLASSVLAFSPVTTKGNAFFKEGQRFYIRGVDYQPGGSSSTSTADPLADGAACRRDVKVFKDLGVNTVRVYSVDPSKNHDECMQLLADNGIHLLLDVNSPSISINRAAPACSYNAFYLKNVFDVVDAFAGYANTLGFCAANEVVNDEQTTATAKYVKAVVRDMKQYLAARGHRQVPVGYSAADIAANRKAQIDYFSCGDDLTARVDFWGHNDYSWCGDSTMAASGYTKLLLEFAQVPVPIFFSEFGCNSVADRPFTEIKAIYSKQMAVVLSGGLVYEYSQEANNYGLVSVSGDTVIPLGGYNNLKKQYAAIADPEGDGGYSESYAVPSCPATSSTWLSDNNLPETPKGAIKMIKEGAGKIISIAELGDTSYKCRNTYSYATGSSTLSSLNNSTASYNSTISYNLAIFHNTTSTSYNPIFTNFSNTTSTNSNTTSTNFNTTNTTINVLPVPTYYSTLSLSLSLSPSSLAASSSPYDSYSSVSPLGSIKAQGASSSASIPAFTNSVSSHAGQPRAVTVPTAVSLLYSVLSIL